MTPTPTWPDDPARHRSLAGELRAGGDELGALAHEIAARALDTHAAAPDLALPTPDARPLCDVATGYFMLGRHAPAQGAYELLLRLRPHAELAAVAWQNLAAIHAGAGDVDESRRCREHAYALQRVFVETPAHPVRRLLILCQGAAAGNVPLDTLLGTGTCVRIKYVIDHADDAEDAALPAHDLVFNAVGEPDIGPGLSARLQRFETRCRVPLLNRPAAVARTQRQALPGRLGALPHAAMAPCLRMETPFADPAALQAALDAAGIEYPVLARPLATHGGEGMLCCDDPAALWAACGRGAGYLSAFRDTRSPDGHWRKYRMIFVDRECHPYHLAISPHWMVHYLTADMEAHAWKIAEERRFLEDPRAVLGERAWSALHAIAGHLDLDYAGIDFTLLPDGDVLVFEANATMLVHLERADGALSHKNEFVMRIVTAFEEMMARATVGSAPLGS